MKSSKNKAFTIIELIFVIVILSILTMMALTKFMTTQNQASEANVKEQIQAIRASIHAEKMQRLTPDDNKPKSGNLTLYYNYRPWEGDTYLRRKNGSVPNHALIMENVDTFQYKAIGDLIKIQLCVKDGNISSDGEYSVCKEKTIF